MALKTRQAEGAGATPASSATPDAATAPDAATTPAVRITARRDGFRRARIAHPATPVEYPAGHWSAEDLARLLAEPELTVEILDA